MKKSFSSRVFRTMVAIGILNATITLLSIEAIYEDIEDTSLTIGLEEERAFFEKKLDPKQIQSWQTALLTVMYVPDDQPSPALPHMFSGRSEPFASEVDIDNETYLISIVRTRADTGVIYLAQDITMQERREDMMQSIGYIIFTGIMVLLSFVLARIGTTRVITPLKTLSRQIRNIHPEQSIEPVTLYSADEELIEITQVLNNLLETLAAYLQREKALISLASHELRTPIAVISGALDVIDNRGTLSNENQKTIARIRHATEKMQADVDALLHLAHQAGQLTSEPVNLANSVRGVLNELENSKDTAIQRISVNWPTQEKLIEADPALVRMLIRNLVQNSLRHTDGQVGISLDEYNLKISDQGPGLPAHIVSRLQTQSPLSEVPDDGLGLFIVKLICERLNWRLDIENDNASSAGIVVWFGNPT